MKIESLKDLEGKLDNQMLELFRKQYKEMGDSNYLTQMQKEAFSRDEFWESEENIIVRGRTSSGKTMVAEMAMAYFGSMERLDNNENKIIYLVPLRVMVSEKRKEFENLFEKHLNWTVFASSSDYQDHDDDIIEGNFKIAVMVYEKFFALLAQDTRFVKKCCLIVIDELQMLNVEDRGAKLEIALTKINMMNKRCKLIGLTTLQCDVLYLQKWMNATEIKCTKRPKGLKEYIIWPDKEKQSSEVQDAIYHLFYYLNEEFIDEDKCANEDKSDSGEHGERKKLYDKIVRPDLKKGKCEKSLVYPLVHYLFSREQNKKPKILIFINYKNSVEEVAKNLGTYLVNNNLINKQIINPINEKFVNLKEAEEDIGDFLNKCLPYKVAYHHGGLSKTVRNFVEEEFRKEDGLIDIVVATGTLAIGVNMPADVVILVGTRLPKSGDKKANMSSSEYKNYIGRAGRLGLRTADCGESYLIVTSQSEANDYWSKYVKAKPINIMSHLLNLNNKEKAPFALNLVQCNTGIAGNSGDFNIGQYESAMNNLFFQYCLENNRKKIENGEQIEIPNKGSEDYKAQLDELEREQLIERQTGQANYAITRKGEKLAGYALNLNTVNIIRNLQEWIMAYYVSERERIETEYEDDDKAKAKIERKVFFSLFHIYFLDILFELCTAVEVNKGIDEDKPEDTGNAIRYLRKKEANLLPKGLLRRILDTYEKDYGKLPNQSKGLALKHAVLLYEWCGGYTVKNIRKRTGISSAKLGDMDRLGDVVAYLWEALSYSFEEYGINEKWCNGLAKEAGKIKYGVPEDTVLLASRHVGFLSRERLMKLRKEAEQRHVDVKSYVSNIKNKETTGIPRSVFQELYDAIKAYEQMKGILDETDKLYRTQKISEDTRTILWNYEENAQLTVNDICRLFSEGNTTAEWEIVGECLIRLRYKQKVFWVFPMLEENEASQIRIVRNMIDELNPNEMNNIKNNNLILISNDKIEKNEEQITYRLFIAMYKKSLLSLGNIYPLLDILTMKYHLVEESYLDDIIALYEEREEDEDDVLLKKKVDDYIMNMLCSKKTNLTLIRDSVINGGGYSNMAVFENNKINKVTVYEAPVNKGNTISNSYNNEIINIENIIRSNCDKQQEEEALSLLREMTSAIEKSMKIDKQTWVDKFRNVLAMGGSIAAITSSPWWSEIVNSIERISCQLLK